MEVLRRGRVSGVARGKGGSLPGSNGSGWIGFHLLWCSVWPNPRAGPVHVRHPVHAAQHMHDIPCQIWIWWLTTPAGGCSQARGEFGLVEMLILT